MPPPDCFVPCVHGLHMHTCAAPNWQFVFDVTRTHECGPPPPPRCRLHCVMLLWGPLEHSARLQEAVVVALALASLVGGPISKPFSEFRISLPIVQPISIPMVLPPAGHRWLCNSPCNMAADMAGVGSLQLG